MSYTPVIPVPPNTQTNRQNLDAALAALIDAFIVSESYAVGRVWKSAMPANLTGEGPLIVMGDVTEAISHDWQTRTTTFTGDLFYVDWVTDEAGMPRVATASSTDGSADAVLRQESAEL